MERKGSAVWTGGLKGGRGTVSTESGAVSEKRYSFGTRFENDAGTNPEELIGAAHAGCFSMALSGELERAGFKPETIETTARVTLEKTDAGFTIMSVHLDTTGTVPGADQAAFEAAANKAKAGCPVSRALKVDISVTARLKGG